MMHIKGLGKISTMKTHSMNMENSIKTLNVHSYWDLKAPNQFLHNFKAIPNISCNFFLKSS